MKKLNIVSFGPKSFDQPRCNYLPTVRISCIRNSISVAARALMKLKDTDCVQIHQDQDKPEVWYLSTVPKGEGFELKPIKKADGLLFYSDALAKEVLGSFAEEKAVSFLVHADPIKTPDATYWKMTVVGADDDNQTDPAGDNEEVVGNTNKRRGRPPGSKKAL